MKPVIKHISFLDEDGGRVVVRCSPNGSFPGHKYKKDLKGRYKKVTVRLTAREFIYKEEILNSDPVLTLLDGNKVRVFTGGDSSYLPASVDGLLERHDKRELVKRKLEEAKKKRTESQKKKSDSTDEYENPFDWFGGYDDTD